MASLSDVVSIALSTGHLLASSAIYTVVRYVNMWHTSTEQCGGDHGREVKLSLCPQIAKTGPMSNAEMAGNKIAKFTLK